MSGKPKSSLPWQPVRYDETVTAAIRALNAGNANADQQQRALRWIIEVAAMTYDQPYRPGGPEGDRDTAFACGRQFVGQQIVKQMKLATS